MAKILRFIKGGLKKIRVEHIIAILIIAGIGGFNLYTEFLPHYKQLQREKNIVVTFDKWWNEVGAQNFEAVGLTADEKLKQEEFNQYRERYLAQNPSYVVEDRLKEMPAEFRTWWETKGGKEEFIKEHNVYPTDRDYDKELRKWLKAYMNKYPRYALAFVPMDNNFGQLFTSWILFPSTLSFLIFAVLAFFSFVSLRKRWGTLATAGFFFGFAIIGGVLVQVLTFTSFFDHYSDMRYMGCSLALVFMLGANSLSLRKGEIPNIVVIVSVLGAMLDIFVNWKINSGIFNAVAVLSPVMFAFGCLAGVKMPERRKTQKEIAAEEGEERRRQMANTDTASASRAQNQKLFETGFAEAKAGRLDNANRILIQAVSAALQEYPVDRQRLKSVAEKIVSPDVFIEFPSMQWMEWGESAKGKNAPEAALVFLEKALKLEKKENNARRAIFNIGEIRVLCNLDREEGIRRLKQVIEMNGTDVLAAHAAKILQIAANRKR